MKYILLSAALVGADQWLKAWATANLTLRGEWLPLLGQLLGLRLTHNYGAAWGMLSDHRWVFILVTAIAIVILPIFLYRYRKLHFMFGFSLSLIIGGAIGNMIDRVFLGYVVDFLEATFIDFPVFNVADICVVCGAIMMFVYIAFIDKTLFADKPKALKTEIEVTNDGTDDKTN